MGGATQTDPAPPCGVAQQENGFPALLTSDDQLFMFEAAGVLIVGGDSAVERKQALMRSLLLPLMDAFRLLLAKLLQETEEERQAVLADCLSHAVGFARSALTPDPWRSLLVVTSSSDPWW